MCFWLLIDVDIFYINQYLAEFFAFFSLVTVDLNSSKFWFLVCKMSVNN